MTTTGAIHGYTYGTREVATSPVGLADLRDLERAVGFDADDALALRELWPVLAGRRDELFGLFMERVAHFFLPTFAGADGEPIDEYVQAAHPRFLKWIEDTCTRPYDQAWLDYQHEIALRHHRTKKNRTDGSRSSVAEVPFRYLVAALYPLASALEPFLVDHGVEASRVRRLSAAWTKSLILQVALWSRPYAGDGW